MKENARLGSKNPLPFDNVKEREAKLGQASFAEIDDFLAGLQQRLVRRKRVRIRQIGNVAAVR
jgi:hypothetical protein